MTRVYRPSWLREVAVYRGEELVVMGTIIECAEKLKVQPETIYFYLMPSYQRRLEKRKHPESATLVVRLDEDDD